MEIIYWIFLIGFVFLLFLILKRKPKTEKEVYAFGDIHGDFEQFIKVLKLINAVDKDLNWKLKDNIVISVGDITDRGPDTKKCFELIRKLQKQAKDAGGEFVQLLGNHEAMNIMNQLDYVNPLDTESYGGHWNRISEYSPIGDTGKWIRELPVVYKIYDTVFVHAGIEPAVASMGIEKINKTIKEVWNNPTTYHAQLLLGENGPLWTRKLALLPDNECEKILNTSLKYLDAKAMVVGHTNPRMRDENLTPGKIGFRCNKKLALIDIGIGKTLGGYVNAVRIYPGGKVEDINFSNI